MLSSDDSGDHGGDHDGSRAALLPGQCGSRAWLLTTLLDQLSQMLGLITTITTDQGDVVEPEHV